MDSDSTRHYAFFQNRACEYYPCHEGADPEAFSCLFCYCPLYCLGDRCGGGFRYLENGVKDCSGCLYPHIPGNYDAVVRRLPEVADLAAKHRRKDS